MAIKYKDIIARIAVNICSFSLAAIFIFSGFTKAVDPEGGAIKLSEYFAAFGMEALCHDVLLAVLAVVQAVAEFMLGVYMLLGMRRKTIAWATLILMLFMTVLTLVIARTDVVTNCGCFGDAVSLDNWATFYKNLALTAAAVVVTLAPAKGVRLLRPKTEWLAKIYSLAVVLCVSVYSYHYLPIVDFRPFYVGQNIVNGMSIPEDAEPPVYETIFTLEKNGERKQFTLNDYPDSTWTFVDSETKMIKRGYQPEILNFAVYDYESGNDETDALLGDDNYAFWLVMPYIEKSDNGVIDAIEDIYDYAMLYGYNICGMTASDASQIEEWKHRAGIDFRFFNADDVMLKTMIRSNPGLLLVRGGTIVRKLSTNNLPDADRLTERLEKQPVNYGTEINGLKGAFMYLGCFIIPLIFLIFADKYRARKKRRASALNN